MRSRASPPSGFANVIPAAIVSRLKAVSNCDHIRESGNLISVDQEWWYDHDVQKLKKAMGYSNPGDGE